MVGSSNSNDCRVGHQRRSHGDLLRIPRENPTTRSSRRAQRVQLTQQPLGPGLDLRTAQAHEPPDRPRVRFERLQHPAEERRNRDLAVGIDKR
jgi:hypothetical protein